MSILFTPGPIKAINGLYENLGSLEVHHRSDAFLSIYKKMRVDMREFLGMEDVAFLTCSGSGGMESALLAGALRCRQASAQNANAGADNTDGKGGAGAGGAGTKSGKGAKGHAYNVDGKGGSHILVLAAGKFGARFGAIAAASALPYVQYNLPLVDIYDKGLILGLLKKHDIGCVTLCAVESQSGIKQPYAELTRAIKNYDPSIVIVIDAIASIGADPMDFSHADLVVASSQKAFTLPIGLSIIGLSRLAIELLSRAASGANTLPPDFAYDGHGMYLSLAREYASQRLDKSAYSPSTICIMLLGRYLSYVKSASFGGDKNSRDGGKGSGVKLGEDAIIARTKALAISTRLALRELGIGTLGGYEADDKRLGNFLSVFVYDKSDALKAALAKEGIYIAGAQDELASRCFRIGHGSDYSLEEEGALIDAIEEFVLADGLDGYKRGRAKEAFLASFARLGG